MSAGESGSERAAGGSGWGGVIAFLLRFVAISILTVFAGLLYRRFDDSFQLWSWSFFGLAAALGFGLELVFSAAVNRFWPLPLADRVMRASIMAVLVSGLGATGAYFIVLFVALSASL